MTVHIVMWKFKDSVDQAEAYGIIKAELEGLLGVVPGLQTLEFGLNINQSEFAWDISLRTTHDDEAALAGYQIHPAHKAAAEVVGKYVNQRAVVDWNS